MTAMFSRCQSYIWNTIILHNIMFMCIGPVCLILLYVFRSLPAPLWLLFSTTSSWLPSVGCCVKELYSTTSWSKCLELTSVNGSTSSQLLVGVSGSADHVVEDTLDCPCSFPPVQVSPSQLLVCQLVLGGTTIAFLSLTTPPALCIM